jgi:hypothetical protein
MAALVGRWLSAGLCCTVSTTCVEAVHKYRHFRTKPASDYCVLHTQLDESKGKAVPLHTMETQGGQEV